MRFMQICIVTIGIPARISTLNRVARSLVDHGAHVHVVSGRRSAAWLLAPCCDFSLIAQHTANQYDDTLNPLFADQPLPERATLQLDAGVGLIDRLRRIEPTLVLVDSEMHVEQLTTEAAGFCTLALEYHLSPDRVRGIPPLSSHFIPAAGPVDRWRCHRIWGQLHRHRQSRPELRNYWHSLARLCDGLSRDFHSVADHGHWQPVRFRHIPTVRLAPLALDLPHARTPQPRFPAPPARAGDFDPVADHDPSLADWIANRQRPLIICTAGSLIRDTRFSDSFIELARKYPKSDFLIAAIETGQAGSLPPNIRCADYLPQQFALRHADLIISGAGVATLIESVQNDVPVVAVSHGVLDQNGNAARIHHHGIGRRLANAELSPSQLQQSFASVDESCRDQVKRLRQRIDLEVKGNNLMAHLRQKASERGISTRVG